jgi:hypothetical protein
MRETVEVKERIQRAGLKGMLRREVKVGEGKALQAARDTVRERHIQRDGRKTKGKTEALGVDVEGVAG